MKPRLLVLLFVLLTGLSLVRAQAPTRASGPHIGYVYPAGGKQGTTFSVTVGGQFLEGVTKVELFGNGISARVVDYLRPTNQKEDDELKAELEKLQEKRRQSQKTPSTPSAPAPTQAKPATTEKSAAPAPAPAAQASSAAPTAAVPASGPSAAQSATPPAQPVVWTPEDEKRVEEIRQRLAYRMNVQTAPAICEAVVLAVTIDSEAAPGDREIRLRSNTGLSNPLMFVVGQLDEFSEPAAFPNTMVPEGRNPNNPRPALPNPERKITIPAVVNGQILPGQVDRIRFSATKGQKLVIYARARALIPYLADAVPGWFQAVMALYDSKGHELAYDDRFQFNPDPVLFYEIREDGDYVVEIKDSIYRGRQDFVYRISIGELPFITSIFPLGGPAGAKTPVELRGWNLTSTKAIMDATNRAPGELELMVPHNGLYSNKVAFVLDQEPEVLETEPNDTVEQAQKLTLPVIVNGRISKPDDHDVFSFEGHAGQEVVIEVFARRLNSPLDSILQLTDAQGKQIAANDDYDDKSDGLNAHHADSRLMLKLPADGTYYIHLADTQHQGGPEFVYRLHVRPPRPDFELRIAPSNINVRGNTYAPMTVYALRKDGFNGEIELGLHDTSRSFGLNGAKIPAGQDRVRFTLTTPATPRDDAYPVSFLGRATINGKQVIHEAVPAEDMMQAFAYRHLVPVKETKVQVIGRGNVAKSAFQLIDKTPLKLPAGGTAKFHVAVQTGQTFENIQVELSEPPDGISVQKTTGSGTVEITFLTDAAKVKPGQQGNLILMVTGERANAAEKKDAKGKKAPRIPLTALPAVPYEIVAP